MLSPPVNTFEQTVQSIADGTRWTATNGTSVTPAQNTLGSYATMIAGGGFTFDVWDLDFTANLIGVSGVARDGVISIAADPAGGTAFAGNEIGSFLVGPASPMQAGAGALQGGTRFRLPLGIPASASIGVAGQVNSATLTAFGVFCLVRGGPSHPEMVRRGAYVDAFGLTLASSAGTAITPGTTSDGAWVQIGSALTRPCWYWEFGYGINSTAIQGSVLAVDIALGDATTKRIVIANAPVHCSANEHITKPRAGEYAWGAIGDLVYARSQASGTLETGHSVAVYGVGG